jgi:hypothetical protein
MHDGLSFITTDGSQLATWHLRHAASILSACLVGRGLGMHDAKRLGTYRCFYVDFSCPRISPPQLWRDRRRSRQPRTLYNSCTIETANKFV